MVQHHNREGQQFGNYRLERLLGRGGFAEVYLGYHLRLQRQAAIKILHAHLSEQEVAAFQREAQIIAALNHPNIVRIFDFDVQHGIPFLVMDYLPHGTLRQRHSRGERVHLSTVISYTKQVANALQYAHDQRLIHRDVKPENMLIGLRNEVVLSDFGIAAIAHSTTSRTAQESIGTIPYMAPEQIQAQARTASDQYALGIVVYEWLSGERPFEGSSPEIFAKHLMAPPPPLCQKVATLVPEVEQVVLKALAKEPGERFGSVQDFALALEQASLPKQSASVFPQPASPPVLPLSLPTASAQVPTKEGDSPLVAAIPTQPDAQTKSSPPPAQVHSSPPRSLIRLHTSRTRMEIPRKKTILWLSIASLTVVALSVLLGTLVYELTGQSYGFLLWPVGLVLSFVSWLGAANRASKMREWTWGGCLMVTFLPPLGSISALIYAALCSADPLCTYREHSDRVESVAWSPDGKRIASASSDHTVHTWDATDGSGTAVYCGHSGPVESVAWSPDGKRIASASSDHTVHVWDAVDGSIATIYRGHSGPVKSVTWSPDGKRIASASSDGTVQIWNAADGGNTYFYRGHFSRIESVAWSPDSRRIASASSDYTVHVWDAVDGNAFIYRGHSGGVDSVAWSPDGKAIASGSTDKTVQVWNATDGSNVFIYKGHSEPVHSVAWSPNGKCVVSGSGFSNYGTMQVWDATDRGNVRKHKGPSGQVWSVTWSPDGKRIASSSGNNGTVQMWNAMEVAGFSGFL